MTVALLYSIALPNASGIHNILKETEICFVVRKLRGLLRPVVPCGYAWAALAFLEWEV